MKSGLDVRGEVDGAMNCNSLSEPEDVPGLILTGLMGGNGAKAELEFETG